MSPLKETYLVFAHEMRRSLRSARTLVFLILYGLATAVFGLVVVSMTRKVQEQINSVTHGEDLSPDTLFQMKTGVLGMFFGKEETMLKYLAEIPLIVLLFASFALFFLPALSALIGFDTVSGELQSRSLRFVSLRARRGSVLAGKVLGQLGLLVGLTAVMNLAVFVYAALSVHGFTVGPGLLAMVRFWGLMLIYATTYVGLTTLCSTLFRTPIFSLLTTFSVLFGFVVLWLMSKFDSLEPIGWFLPSSYKDGLFSPQPIPVLTSVGVYLGFAAIFLGLAWLALRTRDL
jgi:ABC-type transport system involved in multi-copper enzyme maturation permease subunit